MMVRTIIVNNATNKNRQIKHRRRPKYVLIYKPNIYNLYTREKKPL